MIPCYVYYRWTDHISNILVQDKTASSVGAIDVWDWKDREWKLETEMSIPRHGHALAYLGTQLIIIGKKCFTFNPSVQFKL